MIPSLCLLTLAITPIHSEVKGASVVTKKKKMHRKLTVIKKEREKKSRDEPQLTVLSHLKEKRERKREKEIKAT